MDPGPETAQAEPNSPAVPPPFSVVDKGTPVFAQIADQVVRAIKEGRLSIGDRLPTEASLAAQFGASRASVREALSSLQFVGYLESRRGSGSVVRSAAPEGAAHRGGGLRSVPEVVDILEARLLVESEAVRQAATNPPPRALGALRRLLQGMEVALERPELHARTDLSVHLALARACPNRSLAQVAEQLINRTEGRLWRSIRDRAWEEGRLPRIWLGHHEAILRAVTGRDPEAAQAAIRIHLLSVLGNVAATSPLPEPERDRVARLEARYGPAPARSRTRRPSPRTGGVPPPRSSVPGRPRSTRAPEPEEDP